MGIYFYRITPYNDYGRYFAPNRGAFIDTFMPFFGFSIFDRIMYPYGLFKILNFSYKPINSYEICPQRSFDYSDYLNSDRDYKTSRKPLYDCNSPTERKMNAENINTTNNHINASNSKPISKEEVRKLISKLCKELDADEHLINAIVKKESKYNSNKTSDAGAMGLMQLIPGTAKSLGVKDAYDPEQNLRGGIKYFKELLKQFKNNIPLALAAYNAGPTRVRKLGKIPENKQTQTFVKVVLKYYEEFKAGKT